MIKRHRLVQLFICCLALVLVMNIVACSNGLFRSGSNTDNTVESRETSTDSEAGTDTGESETTDEFDNSNSGDNFTPRY